MKCSCWDSTAAALAVAQRRKRDHDGTAPKAQSPRHGADAGARWHSIDRRLVRAPRERRDREGPAPIGQSRWPSADSAIATTWRRSPSLVIASKGWEQPPGQGLWQWRVRAGTAPTSRSR